MRSASVGQQCVECVGEGARSTRQARTTFGGLPAAGAVVTWTLVAINVAVFLVRRVEIGGGQVVAFAGGVRGRPCRTPGEPAALIDRHARTVDQRRENLNTVR